jgi:hypothetical protein
MTDAHHRVTARSAERLRSLWSRDRPAFGLWSLVADPVVGELVAATEFATSASTSSTAWARSASCRP